MSVFDTSYFNHGASYIVDDDAYQRFIEDNPKLGRPNDACGELFVAPSDEIDKALQESGGDKRKLEQILGLPSNTFGDGPLHRIDIQNPCDPSLDIRAATGEEAGAGEYWNTSVHSDRSLPEAEYIKDTKDYTIKEKLGNGNPNKYADIDANKTPDLSEFKGNYNACYDYAGTDTSQQAMGDYLESHGIQINGPYTCEFRDGDPTKGVPNQIVIHHPANAEGYDYKTSGGLHEAVLNQVPNDEAHVTHTIYGEIAPGQVDIKHPMPNHEAYPNSHDIKADPEQPRAPTENTDAGSSAKLISSDGNDKSTSSATREKSVENTSTHSEYPAKELSSDASSLASETHDSTHSSDDIAKDNSHADADAIEAKRDSASESKEASKDIASEPEGAGAKEQQNSSQAEQGDHEQASSKTSANAADDSLSRTKTADVSEKATESGSGSLEHETGKAQHASEITANTPEESGQASVTQPDNNLTKDADNESSHGQSESNAQNTEPSHASPDQAKQSDESRTNNADRSQTLEGEMPHDAVGKSANDGHETSQTNNSVEASENVGRNEHAPSDQEAENTDHQTPHGQTGSTEQHDHPAADTADKNNVAENHKADDTAEKAGNNSADAHVEKEGTSQDSALANEPADAQRPSASSDDTSKSNEAQNSVQSGNQVAEDNAAHDVTRENANGHNETATVSQSEAANGRENAPATSANTSNAEAAKPDAETNHPEREQSSDKASVNAPQEENNTAAAQYNSGENGRNSTPEHQATQEQNPGINSDKAVATPETNTKDRATDQASAAESPKQDSSALAYSAQSTASDSYNREQPSSNTPQRDSTALAGADSQKRNERPEQSNTTGPNVNDHSADKAYENGNTHKEASASQSAYDGNKNGESSDVPDSYRHSDTRTGADESNESTGMQNRWDTQNQRSHSADAENNSDGMPSKGRDTHLSNDAAMPPNTYQHNSDQNETAEGMSSSENVAATSDKSDSKASTQNSEVSENSTPRNDDSAQIPNSVDGKDTNSGAEKASGNSLNSSGSTNEFKNNGYQQ